MRKKVLYVILIVLMILPSIIPIGVYAIENNIPSNSQSDKTEIANDIDNQEDTSNYSQAYLEYLELSDEEKAKLSVIPRKYNVPLDSIYEDTIEVEEKPNFYNLFGLRADTILVSTYADELPTSFNLRNEIEIPTKDQGEYGLCWAFSSLRALETNLALNGYGYYDFSELHLGHIRTIWAWVSDPYAGGEFSMFEEYAFRNYGPVYEENVPYNAVYDMNNEEDANYLLSLESKAYNVQTIDFPTIDKISNDYTEEQLNLFREKIKKHIIENGSIYATIDSKGIKDINGYSSLYNSTGFINHAISIIGWDDSFAKENFQDENGNIPNKDGAYIALNSWGNYTGAGTGDIFYISYEDATVERDMSGVVSATTNFDEVDLEEIKFEDRNLYDIIKEELGKNIITYNDDTLTLYVLNTNQELLLNLDSEFTR